MSHEGFSTVTQEQAAVAGEAVFHQDGSLNEVSLGERFGIGVDVAMQEVTFGRYRGTVAQMLADGGCPVGEMVSTAYQEKGIAGVAEKFKALSEMDPNFSVEIPAATIEREQLKKK
jgi:hypothetical protein